MSEKENLREERASIMSDLTKADLHSHTYYSLLRIPKLKGNHFAQDSALSPKLLVKLSRRKKIDALALTDHDNMNGIKSFLHYTTKYTDIVPIVGQEVTKYDQTRRSWAHILVYGLRKIPWNIRFRPLPEFLDYLDDNNAVYVLAHPFDLSQSAPAGGYDRNTYKINFAILRRFRMIEVVNGLQPKRHNYLAQIISRELGLPGIAGGDSHQPNMVGRCFTYVEGTTEDEILEYLRKVKKSPKSHKLRTHGTGSTPKIWDDWFFYVLLNLKRNLRYDIYRHLNPKASHPIRNPVYDKLYYHVPLLPKILVQAALPYVFWALLAGLKIYGPRMLIKSRKKEVKVLKSLIYHQAMNENSDILSLDLPFSEKEFTHFQQI
ncbi:MAG: PHP domain-containing protein [Candidatus Hodarchaeales archaeon]|jgi:predicted metal-dependent phosphoesterase TrpH